MLSRNSILMFLNFKSNIVEIYLSINFKLFLKFRVVVYQVQKAPALHFALIFVQSVIEMTL